MTGKLIGVVIAVAAASMMWCGVAGAQEISPPPELPDEGDEAGVDGADAEAGFSAGLGLDVTFGQLAEDWFVNLLVRFEFAVGKLQVGIQAPLRLRVIDEAPENEGVVREEDWDEVSDYFKIVRYVQWSQPDDVFYARIGELSGATLGHGTMMRNYLNVIDIDHFQLGVDTKVNTVWGGGELVLDNVADPEILGLRLYTRPWAFVDPESYATGWSVGTSFLADFVSPVTIEVDETTMQPVVDDENNLQYSDDVTAMWGIDTDFTVLDNDWVQITPYTDFNLLFTEETGFGYHLGVNTIFTLPAESIIGARLEYRYLGDYYSAQYVDSLYEVQRIVYPSPVAYPPDVVPLTKRSVIGAADEGAHGYMGELLADIMGIVRIVGTLSGSQRERDNNLLLHASVPALEVFQVGAVYTKAGFDDFVDAFDPDGAFLQAYARYNTGYFISIIAQFSRRWQLVTEPGADNFGSYEVVDEWGVGLGASIDF